MRFRNAQSFLGGLKQDGSDPVAASFFADVNRNDVTDAAAAGFGDKKTNDGWACSHCHSCPVCVTWDFYG